METIFSSAAPRPTKNTRSAAKPHRTSTRSAAASYFIPDSDLTFLGALAKRPQIAKGTRRRTKCTIKSQQGIRLEFLFWPDTFLEHVSVVNQNLLAISPSGDLFLFTFGGTIFDVDGIHLNFVPLTSPHRKWFIGWNHNDLLVSNFILINWMAKQSRLIVITEKIFSPVIWLLRGPAL